MFENFFSSAKKEEPKKTPEKAPVDSVNTLKSEHLSAGVSPIVSCVGTMDDFCDKNGKMDDTIEKIFVDNEEPENVEDVDYYIEGDDLVNRNLKNAGAFSFVISTVNDKDKISRGYKNCTGVVISGTDKKTGKNVSFLSHQDPDYFLSKNKNSETFVRALKEQAEEIKKKCVPGTIDAVIYGGNYFNKEDYGDDEAEEFQRDYLNSINTISSEIKNTFGFAPPVVVGPKMISGGDDNVYYDNEHRRLYIVRPKVGDITTESYLPKEISEQEKKWKNEK